MHSGVKLVHIGARIHKLLVFSCPWDALQPQIHLLLSKSFSYAITALAVVPQVSRIYGSFNVSASFIQCKLISWVSQDQTNNLAAVLQIYKLYQVLKLPSYCILFTEPAVSQLCTVKPRAFCSPFWWRQATYLCNAYNYSKLKILRKDAYRDGIKRKGDKIGMGYMKHG